MVKTPHFHCRDTGSILDRGIKIPHAALDGQQKVQWRWYVKRCGQDEGIAGGSDLPGTSHRGRLLPSWKGQGAKMVLLDYDGEAPHRVCSQRRTSYEWGGPTYFSSSLLNSVLPTPATDKSSCQARGQKSLVMSSIEIYHEAQSRPEGSRHESATARGG